MQHFINLYNIEVEKKMKDKQNEPKFFSYFITIIIIKNNESKKNVLNFYSRVIGEAKNFYFCILHKGKIIFANNSLEELVFKMHKENFEYQNAEDTFKEQKIKENVEKFLTEIISCRNGKNFMENLNLILVSRYQQKLKCKIPNLKIKIKNDKNSEEVVLDDKSDKTQIDSLHTPQQLSGITFRLLDSALDYIKNNGKIRNSQKSQKLDIVKDNIYNDEYSYNNNYFECYVNINICNEEIPQENSFVEIEIYDITKVKLAEKKIIEESINKQKVLSKVAHEFKTPLHAITSLCKILRENTNDKKNNYVQFTNNINCLDKIKTIDNYAKNIENISDYVIFLVTDFIQTSKGKEFTVDSISNVNITEVANFSFDILQTLLYLYDKKKVIPKLDIGPNVNDFDFKADEVRIKQIFLNLISNSVKFTKFGSITISVKILDYNPYSINDKSILNSKNNSNTLISTINTNDNLKLLEKAKTKENIFTFSNTQILVNQNMSLVEGNSIKKPPLINSHYVERKNSLNRLGTVNIIDEKEKADNYFSKLSNYNTGNISNNNNKEYYLQITFSDTGPGIHSSQLKILKEKNFDYLTVGGTNENNPHGTGLGLSISYIIAKKLNINMTVESDNKKGTTFTLTKRVEKKTDIEILKNNSNLILNSDFSNKSFVSKNETDEDESKISSNSFFSDINKEISYKPDNNDTIISNSILKKNKSSTSKYNLNTYNSKQLNNNSIKIEDLSIRHIKCSTNSIKYPSKKNLKSTSFGKIEKYDFNDIGSGSNAEKNIETKKMISKSKKMTSQSGSKNTSNNSFNLNLKDENQSLIFNNKLSGDKVNCQNSNILEKEVEIKENLFKDKPYNYNFYNFKNQTPNAPRVEEKSSEKLEFYRKKNANSNDNINEILYTDRTALYDFKDSFYVNFENVKNSNDVVYKNLTEIIPKGSNYSLNNMNFNFNQLRSKDDIEGKNQTFSVKGDKSQGSSRGNVNELIEIKPRQGKKSSLKDEMFYEKNKQLHVNFNISNFQKNETSNIHKKSISFDVNKDAILKSLGTINSIYIQADNKESLSKLIEKNSEAAKNSFTKMNTYSMKKRSKSVVLKQIKKVKSIVENPRSIKFPKNIKSKNNIFRKQALKLDCKFYSDEEKLFNFQSLLSNLNHDLKYEKSYATDSYASSSRSVDYLNFSKYDSSYSNLRSNIKKKINNKKDNHKNLNIFIQDNLEVPGNDFNSKNQTGKFNINNMSFLSPKNHMHNSIKRNRKTHRASTNTCNGDLKFSQEKYFKAIMNITESNNIKKLQTKESTDMKGSHPIQSNKKRKSIKKRETISTVNTNIINSINLKIPRNIEEDLNKIEIMVVDDSLIIRNSLTNSVKNCLKKIGIKATIVEGQDGIDILKYIKEDQEKGNQVKLVFSDENMNYLNGSEAVSQLKKLESQSKFKSIPPVICVTAMDTVDEYFRQHFLNEIGFTDIIDKTPHYDKLTRILKTYLL